MPTILMKHPAYRVGSKNVSKARFPSNATQVTNATNVANAATKAQRQKRFVAFVGCVALD